MLYQGVYSFAQAIEIGEGGLMFETAEDMEKGELVVVSFYIPGFRHAIARGVIRYKVSEEEKSKGDMLKYGIEFQTIDFDSKRHIRYYVASDLQSLKTKKPTQNSVGF